MRKSSRSSSSTKYDSFESPSAEVRRDLENAESFSVFLAKNKENMLDETLSEHLMMLLDRKNLLRSDVVNNSGLEKSYVYQIFKGEKKPSRDKLIAIAFGLHLNEEETQRMLKLAGHSELYARVTRDALILFAIQHGMSIDKVDNELDANGLPTLHSPE